METKNPKDYWKFLKSINTKNESSQPKLDSFYEYFKNINESNEPTEIFTETVDENVILNSKITIEEIKKCIKNLKNGKSPGEDKILNEYIKSTQYIFLPIYEKLFNYVFDSGIIPISWLEGIIRPIYKNKGDPKLVNNYRPITILSCLGKLFTAVLNNRLTMYLDNENILNENQAGFRQGYSTNDNIFVLHSLIEVIKKGRQKLYCAFIDFSQAFDSVWRGGLWRKLNFNTIKGKFFRIIYNMYENIKSCVKNNNQTSSYFPSQCGVRQGENLSPVLFSIYLNDLETFLLSGGVNSLDLQILGEDAYTYLKLLILLYADDTTIFSNDKENFQKALDNFGDYCKLWKLTVNYEKSNVIIFNSRRKENISFKLNDCEITVTDRYKYLGVIFSKSGSFLNARKHIVEQAKKAMHLLFIKANNLNLPIDLQLKLFDYTVLPILTYGCETWGFESTEIIESVHLEFLRKIMKVRKSTPKYMLYAETGRYPLRIIIKQRMLNFWTRIVTGKTSKLSYRIYLFMINSNYTNFKWLNFIQTILNESGRYDLWVQQFGPLPIFTGKIIKRVLLDQFFQTWNGLLEMSSKGRNYSLIKSNLYFENYLKNLNGSLAINMFKFRTGNHKLPIEVGRWNNIDISERKCNLCQTANIGDEFHYLLECPYFQTDREQLVDRYYYSRPNIIKYKQLFQITNKTKLIRLSRFMKLIMNYFNNCSYLS